MKVKLLTIVIAASLGSPMAFAIDALTVGKGKTDFELITPNQTFTSAEWDDLSLTYTSRSNSGGFFNIDYRTSLSAEHNTFADDTGSAAYADLDDTRLSITAGGEVFYVGYLQSDTTISAPTGRSSGAGTVNYDLEGFTIGFKNAAHLGDGHYFQFGAGYLLASADLTQVYINSSTVYSAEYSYSSGYFYGLGLSGPIGTSGFAYSLKYEIQKIDLEGIDSDTDKLEDERSRVSANLTYVFL